MTKRYCFDIVDRDGKNGVFITEATTLKEALTRLDYKYGYGGCYIERRTVITEYPKLHRKDDK